MKPSLFGKIQSEWDNIVQNLDVKRVCDVLMTKFTLLPNELQTINRRDSDEAQARQLLEILKVKDDQHFENFLSVLDTTDHENIADAIRKAKVPREYVEPAFDGATASSSSDGPIDSISSLRPYQNRWKICPRITNKSRITFYRNSKNKWDKHLNLTFTDASGSINAVAFGQTADKFNGLLEEQKVYYVSNATIRQNKMMFMGGNAYDMTLTDDTNIKLCEEEHSLALPTQIPFKSVMIDKLESGKLYDVIGVVKDHREKTVKNWHGIDVQIVDQSKKMVSLNLSKKDVEKHDLRGNPVLAVNGVCLKRSYGHVYLKMMPNSKLQVNPADIPETDLLKRWFEKEGRQIEFEKI